MSYFILALWRVGFLSTLLTGSAVRCDILGPTYPPPTDLSSLDSLVYQAWSNVSAHLDSYLEHNSSTATSADLAGLENITFSAGLFSLHDNAATSLQYHYTAAQIAESTTGTQAVDADSIYRVASVSKVITVLTALLTLSREQLNEPITHFIPELRLSMTGPSLWEEITPWTLASQLAGLQSIGLLGDEVLSLAITAASTNTSPLDIATASGLPLVDPSFFGPCLLNLSCTAEQYVASGASAAFVVLPDTTPIYSNLGSMILGLAVSRAAGKPYDELYNSTIFEPLGMTSSYTNAPLSDSLLSRSVIAGPLVGSWSFSNNFYTIPSGGLLSTLNDLNRLGLAILHSTLLTPSQTRRWLKPRSHTASLTYSVGAPWEIVRYMHNDTGKVTDIYTKLGDSGAYGGMLAIIPEYEAGFSFLNALYEPPTGPQIRGEVALRIINTIAEAIVPALEAQAAREAERNFAGTYSSTDTAVNSSLVVGFNTSTVLTPKSGLTIEKWVSNGTDMLSTYFRRGRPRLLPSLPSSSSQNSTAGKLTLQASLQPQWPTYAAAGLGPFSGVYDSNFGWFTFDGPRYIGAGVNTFVFEVDNCGEAVAVVNAAARLRMAKVIEH